MLRIKRRRFFELLAKYRKDPDIEQNIVKVLRKKDDPSLAIGEKYINKNVSFSFNFLFMDVFTYR